MKLLKIFERLFYKKNLSTTTAIANLLDCITLPTRSELENNPEKLIQLEEYKTNYSQILSSKRIILSTNLETVDYRDKVNMYIELLLNLLDENEDISLSFENASYYNDGTKKLSFMTKMFKLKAYYYNIEKLELETTLRLVALKEILHDKFFLSPQKKRAIKEQMNSLASSLLVFMNQRQAIHSEIEAYLKEYSLLNKEEFIESNFETALIEQKCQELRTILSSLLDETNTPTNNTQMRQSSFQENSILSISLMEEAIEEYIYNHKQDAVQLRKQLRNLSKFIKDDQELDKIFPCIPKLEMKLKAFSIFGRNLITEEDLRNFYQIKFACLIINIFDEKELTIAKNASHIELECYQEIISKKIEDLLTNNNPNLKRIFQRDQLLAIEDISAILKNGSLEYNFWDILNNKKLLGLIVAFDQPEGLFKYFAKIKELKKDYNNVDFHESIFTFDEVLPLDTIFSMIYYNEAPETSPLYNLYQQMREQSSSYDLTLPEGLLYVNMSEIEFLKDSDRKLVRKIRESTKNRCLKTPSSLLEINGPLFQEIDCEEIILNEGLQKISMKAFIGANAKSLYIPSTITEATSAAFSFERVCEIHFIDFSKMSLTSDSLRSIISSIYKAIRTDKISYKILPQEKMLEKYYHESMPPHVYRDLIKNYHLYNLSSNFLLEPKFARIILEENSQEILSLKADEITLKSFREWQRLGRASRTPFNLLNRRYIYGLYDSETDKVYEHISNLIKKRLKTLDEPKKLEKKLSTQT